MKVALLCIGDELLKGSTVNTNLAFLGEQLLRIGIIPELSLEIPDRRDSILKALDYAYSKADTVITSGGLGPTSDDITKDSIAEYFHLPLEKNEQVEAHLTAWWQKLHSGPVPFSCCRDRPRNFIRCSRKVCWNGFGKKEKLRFMPL